MLRAEEGGFYLLSMGWERWEIGWGLRSRSFSKVFRDFRTRWQVMRERRVVTTTVSIYYVEIEVRSVGGRRSLRYTFLMRRSDKGKRGKVSSGKRDGRALAV